MEPWIDALVGPITGKTADPGKVAILYLLLGAVGYKLLERV